MLMDGAADCATVDATGPDSGPAPANGPRTRHSKMTSNEGVVFFITET